MGICYNDFMRKDSKGKLINRLSRIAGQLEAVKKMLLNADKTPKEVLSQFNAVISGLESAKIILVEEYTRDSILKSIDNLSELLK